MAQQGLLHCQVNALKTIIPDLEPVEKSIPRGAKDIGDGFILLPAVQKNAEQMKGKELDSLAALWAGCN